MSGFSAGARPLPSQETETLRRTNLLQVSLRREAVLILAHAPRPNQQIFFFFSRHVGSETHWRTGKKKKRREGGKQPRGWREILYACALKHKVCGQLLKDFFRGVKIIHRVNRVKEEERGSAYASATQFCWGNRETLSAQAGFFFLPYSFI